VFLGLLPLMLHAVLMSFSRGGMVSLLAVFPLLVVRSSRKIGMVYFVVGLLLVLPSLAGREIRDRFFSIQDYESEETSNLRFDSWKAGWRIAKDYPIFGVGMRNADLLSYQYGADVPGRTIHSQYLQIAADSGFPSIVLYLLALFLAWRSVRRVQKRYRNSSLKDHQMAYNLACGIEGAMVVFCVGSTFLSVENFELIYLLILLALKLPFALNDETSQTDSFQGISNTNNSSPGFNSRLVAESGR